MVATCKGEVSRVLDVSLGVRSTLVIHGPRSHFWDFRIAVKSVIYPRSAIHDLRSANFPAGLRTVGLNLVAMAGTLPPLFDITDNDEGGYAAVAVYTLLALTLVIVVARLSTRWYIGGGLHSDDILLAVSTVCADFACLILLDSDR